MNCPKCNSDKDVVCHGRRYAIYPSGCLMLIGPILAVLHQASAPVDYECKGCGSNFTRRSTPAKVALVVILLLVIYLYWLVVSQVFGFLGTI